jgi:hypothetical protein
VFCSTNNLIEGRELEYSRIKEVGFMDVLVTDCNVIFAVGSKVPFEVSLLLDCGEMLLESFCDGFGC